ncbi:hypothetical protein C1I97_25145 [Streptomyces sp. NTH33]|uniref:hypothetical protein n=1 Tax=Streptomyces sp. NTH33 TaxID=1735453 RepID=UPI000DA7302A|nr:hypothetical protein [Streptomyces sp. NTH33]PZG97824.1 hypothetical protein C1I97_25145 [Streptomyces sp. NTH33]
MPDNAQLARTRVVPMTTGTTAIPMPAAPVPTAAYDRAVWERALLTSTVRRDLRLLGLILSHHADAAGCLPAGGIQHAESLCALMRMEGRKVRQALNELELAHFIRRPNLHTWPRRDIVRPITLTLPTVAAVRTGPEHPGEAIR